LSRENLYICCCWCCLLLWQPWKIWFPWLQGPKIVKIKLVCSNQSSSR